MRNGKRFFVESSAALLCTAVFVLTLIEPAWIEWVFNEAPDAGDGSLEALIALVSSFVAGGICVRLAWREWRQRPAHSAGRGG